MSEAATLFRMDRPVRAGRDHILGPADAPIELVEYGSYACPYCRAANEEVAKLRDRFGDRMRYVFRQRPITGDPLALRAAEVAEAAPTEEAFWDAHIALMTRSAALGEGDVDEVAANLGLGADATPDRKDRGVARVAEDRASAAASGVTSTPTFFINGRRYDGAWDLQSLSEAMLGSLGHRVHSAAVDFAGWAPSTGLLLGLVSVIAVIVSNSTLSPGFEAFWTQPAAVSIGPWQFSMPVRLWVNDFFLTLFFLVVGLEVKREFTVGRLSQRRAAALPIAAAAGGLVVPALLYLAFIQRGPWVIGAGVPMPTDTAFAVALIVMLGRRVPIELRVFLTAASIVDDIGTILVVALFYSGNLHLGWLAVAAATFVALVLINRASVYRPLPYVILGLVLWATVHAGGLHATLAGVLLALVVPTRPPPNLNMLLAQAESLFAAEARRGENVLRHGPSTATLRAVDAIHDRLESPADRLLRTLEPWSSFVVLPLFALANAGVVVASGMFDGRETLALAIIVGLVVGKPLGFLLASALVVRMGIAEKPRQYDWMQLTGAGALAGIGFTMSLFIAGQAFPVPEDFAAAKLAVFAGSIVSAILGVAILFHAGRDKPGGLDEDSAHPAVAKAA